MDDESDRELQDLLQEYSREVNQNNQICFFWHYFVCVCVCVMYVLKQPSEEDFRVLESGNSIPRIHASGITSSPQRFVVTDHDLISQRKKLGNKKINVKSAKFLRVPNSQQPSDSEYDDKG